MLVVAVTLAFVAITYWVLVDKGLASAAHQAFTDPGLLLAVFGVTVLSAGFHEFGHAAALRRGGGTPEAMGAGLYVIWPAFYTDVTDAYRLGRGARLRTDLGGLYFNAIVSLVIFGLWWAIGWDGFLLVIATQVLQMLRQLPPLMRFDGYHLLADATGVPDLFHRIGPTLRSFVPGRGSDEAKVLRPWVRVAVTAWVVVIVPLLLFSAVLAVVALPRLMASAAQSLNTEWRLLMAQVHRGSAVGAGVKVLAILAIAVPVVGVVVMLARTVRQLVVKGFRSTAGKPRQRAVAGVTAAAVVGGLVFAWWPHGNYKPIQPYERGTIADALPTSFVHSSAGLVAGRVTAATTLLPGTGPSSGHGAVAAGPLSAGGPLPTAAHPVLATVYSPRSGAGPTWVFPFNRPAPPGPGDNQALVVVTRNGGTAYDVAFALVWATSDRVLNINSAYAFASCNRCRAVAVSFQVVLVVGHAHVVVPQNLAAAAGYNCIQCVTAALGDQLVVTLPGAPSAVEAAQLQALWAKIAAFGANAGNLSYAAIEAQLSAYERQILSIVRPNAIPSGQAPGSTTGSTAGGGPAAGGGSPGPGPTPAPAPVPSPGPGALPGSTLPTGSTTSTSAGTSVTTGTTSSTVSSGRSSPGGSTPSTTTPSSPTSTSHSSTPSG